MQHAYCSALTAEQVALSLSPHTIDESVTRAMRLRRALGSISRPDDHAAHVTAWVDAIRASQLDAVAQPKSTNTIPAYTLRRRIRLLRMRNITAWAYRKGRIGADKQPKVAAELIEYRAEMLVEQARYADRATLTSEHGDVCRLADIANTATRRAAYYYARAKGQETYQRERAAAEGREMIALFITATLLGEYHPAPSRPGPAWAWNGSMPWESYALLQSMWRRVQDRLSSAGIKLHGMRCYEAHKDGCPHLHALLYLDAIEDIETVRKAFAAVFAGERACEIRRIDAATAQAEGKKPASPASYIIKYLCKSLSASNLYRKCDDATAGARDDSETLDIAQYRNADATWATLCGGRVIGMMDGGSATVWRELRRIKEHSAEHCDLSRVAGVQAAWRAAHDSDWSAYLTAIDALAEDQIKLRIAYDPTQSTRRVAGVRVEKKHIDDIDRTTYRATICTLLTRKIRWALSLTLGGLRSGGANCAEVRHSYPSLTRCILAPCIISGCKSPICVLHTICNCKLSRRLEAPTCPAAWTQPGRPKSSGTDTVIDATPGRHAGRRQNRQK